MRLRVFLCFISVMAEASFLSTHATDLCPESLTPDQVNNIVRGGKNFYEIHETIEGKHCYGLFNTKLTLMRLL
jgi:hypothetical protein